VLVATLAGAFLPQTFGLAPNQEQTVDVLIEPKDPGFTSAKPSTFTPSPRRKANRGNLSSGKLSRRRTPEETAMAFKHYTQCFQYSLNALSVGVKWRDDVLTDLPQQLL
jgi:hypothetical protein